MTKRNPRMKDSTLGDDAEQIYEKRIRDLESVNEALKVLKLFFLFENFWDFNQNLE